MRVIRLLPGPSNLASVIREVADSETVISALNDAWLLAIREMVGEEATIKPFGKLVDEYAERCGVQMSRTAGAGYELAAISEACAKLPETSPFYACRRFSGAHKSIRSTLHLLRGWNLGMDDLRVLAEQVDDEELGEKLLDLSNMAEDVRDTLLKIGMRSSAERKWQTLAGLMPEEGRAGKVLLVAGSEFEPLDAMWLKWLDSLGTDLTLVMDSPLPSAVPRPCGEGEGLGVRVPEVSPTPSFDVDSSATGEYDFESSGVQESSRTLTPNSSPWEGRGGSGLFAGSEKLVSTLGANSDEVFGTTNVVAANLFAVERREGASIRLRTVRMADPLAEAEWTLRDALDKTKSGTKAGQIAIFSRNLADTYPLFVAASKRLDVPLHATVRVPLLTNGLAKLILRLLQFCASKDVRTLQDILDSSYIGHSSDERNTLIEGLRSAFRCGEAQWDALESWSREVDLDSWLSLLLDWRRKTMQDTHPLRDWMKLLQTLSVLPWYERALGPGAPTVETDGRAIAAMNRALSQRASVDLARSSTRLTLEQFAPIVERAWEDETYHLTTGEEGIRLVGGSPESLPPVEVLYVTGMLEGVFPRRRREDAILTDFDRNRISEIRGGPRLPTSHDDAQAERDLFVRLCATPSQELILSYPLTDENRDNVAAFYLEEAKRAHGDAAKLETRKRSQLTPEECQTEADIRLAGALQGPRAEPANHELQTEAAREEVRARTTDSFAPRDWRLALECPFQSAALRKIQARPRGERRLWNRIYELPSMAGIWTRDTEPEAEIALGETLLELVETVAGEADLHDAALLKAGGRRLIRKLVRREFDSREIWPRQGPTTPNLIFGEEGTRNRIPLRGIGEIGLRGMFSAISFVDGYCIGHVVLSLPQKKPHEEETPLYETTEIGAFWAALAAIGKPCGIEVETIGGGRVLYIAPGPRDGFRADHLRDLKVVRLQGEPNYGRAVQMRFSDAFSQMSSGTVRPRPGQVCERCDMGELCRSAQGFGDNDSPFGSPDED